MAKQKDEKTTAKIAFCETKTYGRRTEKDKNKLKPYCVSLKNGIFSIFFDNCWFDTFPNKDQVYETKPKLSNDYNLKLYGKKLQVRGQGILCVTFPKAGKNVFD